MLEEAGMSQVESLVLRIMQIEHIGFTLVFAIIGNYSLL